MLKINNFLIVLSTFYTQDLRSLVPLHIIKLHISPNYSLPISSSAELVLLLLLKEVGSARLRKSDIYTLFCPDTPAPQYQPIDGKKRKGKIAGDYSRDRASKGQ